MIKVVCVSNKDGNNKTISSLIIGKIYDVELGRQTSPGFGVQDLACGAINAYRDILDSKYYGKHTEETLELYIKESLLLSEKGKDIENNYYWVITELEPFGYNYEKDFFITLAELRDNQINSILND